MQTYKIESPIKVNGRIMKTGVVSLEDDDAQPLLDSGSIAQAPEEPQAGGDKSNEGTGAPVTAQSEPAQADQENDSGDTADVAAAATAGDSDKQDNKPASKATKPASKEKKAKG